MNSEFTQLISVRQLQLLLASASVDNLVILDASISEVNAVQPAPLAWPQTVIAHSQRFDLQKCFSDKNSKLSHTMPTPEQFQYQARALGINQNSQIIIYDHIGIYAAPRAWWMFKSMGFHQVAVLDGGLPEWLARGGSVNRASFVQSPRIGNFVATKNNSYFCNKDRVKQAMLSQSEVIIDARAKGRFSGENKDPRAGVRNGHIPNSVNLPFSDLQQQKKMLPVEQLKAKFAVYINDSDNDNHKVIFSCGSGITACVLALAADICGYQQLTVYDGSWSDWGSDLSLPISQ